LAPLGRRLPLLPAILLVAGCRTLTVEPTSPTEGRFRSEARAIRVIGWSFPYRALPTALGAAAGRGLPNARVTVCETYPDLFFPFTWINWALGFEGATVEGVYGPPP